MTTKDTGGQRQTSRRTEEAEEAAPQANEDVKERQDKLADDVDAILDEIAEETEQAEAGTTEESKERHEKLSDDVDAILDEIDEVLEENAEEFVRSYVQKGGE